MTVQIDPDNIPQSEVARVIYLIARAVSVALRARGATDVRLWQAEPTPLAFWCGLTRGNLLVMLRILIATLRASDARTGPRNSRKVVRFMAARKCLAAASLSAYLIPDGPTHGVPPLKI